MNERTILHRLSLPDRLQVLAFDASLTRTPRPLVTAIWKAIAELEAHPKPPQPKCRKPDPSMTRFRPNHPRD